MRLVGLIEADMNSNAPYRVFPLTVRENRPNVCNVELSSDDGGLPGDNPWLATHLCSDYGRSITKRAASIIRDFLMAICFLVQNYQSSEPPVHSSI